MTQPGLPHSDTPTAVPAAPPHPARRRTVRIVTALVVIATLLILGRALLTPAQSAAPAANGSATPGAPDPQIGHYAPDATLLDLSNRQVDLKSLRGKLVVLNFWYVACEPCQYEMPALEKAYLAYADKGVVVVGINISDDAQTISTFIERLGITYPILRDLGERVALTYQLTATPTSFFLDREGVIRYKQVGPLDTPTINKDLTALLGHS